MMSFDELAAEEKKFGEIFVAVNRTDFFLGSTIKSKCGQNAEIDDERVSRI